MTRPPFPPADDDALAAWVGRALRELPDAPPGWQQAAMSLGAPKRAAATAAPASAGSPAALPSVGAVLRELADAATPALRHVLAVLRFDSFGPQAAPALRHAARGAARQLLFHADGHDIDLRLAPPDRQGRCSLRGQVLGPALDAAEVLLVPAPGVAPPGLAPAGPATFDEARRQPLDPLGEFDFDGLPPGDYRVGLQLGSVLIELPPVTLGQPAAPGPRGA